LQEVVVEYLPLMMKHFPETYQTVGSSSTYFIYNSSVFGQGQLLSHKRLYIIQEGRPMIIVWFPKVELLAVNLHAPHKINLKDGIEKTFNSVKISSSIHPKRIIITGDFNDAYYAPLQELNLMGKVLRQHSSPPKSCCADSSYNYSGDYIFDSDLMMKGFYGVPSDARNPILYHFPSGTKSRLMSDHDPVVFYPN
jgi:hypothetical protein